MTLDGSLCQLASFTVSKVMLDASSGVAQQYKNAFFYYIIIAEFSSAAQAQWKNTNLYITLLNVYVFL